MKVILDANIWLSLLAGSGQEGSRTIMEVVSSVLTDDRFQLIVPIETVEEVERKATTKKYYVQMRAIEQWNEIKSQMAECILTERMIEARIPGSPDPKDDYLLVALALYRVNYLVTGDGNLAKMKEYEGGAIMSPVEFWRIVNT